jgi:enoyl-CoA hydratase/carnithine racemase
MPADQHFEFLTIEVREHLAWLRLRNPPRNDLTPALIQELISAHARLAADPEVWMVLLGAHGEKFYCNGMSPDYLLAQDVAGRANAFAQLFDLMRVMYAFPKIEAAVIGGHAMAGGAVLGILSDFRFMGDGKYRLGFSEVPVGLTIPAFLIDLIEGVVGPRYVKKVALLGTAFRAEEAHAIGLVDEVFAHAELEAQAENYFRRLMQSLPQASLRSVKRNMRAGRLAKLEAAAGSEQHLRDFLSGNFEEGLRAVLERRKPVYTNP